MRSIGIIFLIIAGVYLFGTKGVTPPRTDAVGFGPTVVPPTPLILDSDAKARIARNDAVTNLKLKDYTWSKSDFGVMTATFTFDNHSDYDVKDIEVRCDHSAPSGTTIDKNVRTIYDVVSARSQRTFKNFNMGFIASQAQRTGCRITDAVAGELRPPPAAKAPPPLPRAAPPKPPATAAKPTVADRFSDLPKN